jgi:hypothetical protein
LRSVGSDDDGLAEVPGALATSTVGVVGAPD